MSEGVNAVFWRKTFACGAREAWQCCEVLKGFVRYAELWQHLAFVGSIKTVVKEPGAFGRYNAEHSDPYVLVSEPNDNHLYSPCIWYEALQDANELLRDDSFRFAGKTRTNPRPAVEA